MVKKMLERAIEIEGLLRIIREGNPLPETYTLLSNKAVELAEDAMLLEEQTYASQSETIEQQITEEEENNIEEQVTETDVQEAETDIQEAETDIQEAETDIQEAETDIQEAEAEEEGKQETETEETQESEIEEEEKLAPKADVTMIVMAEDPIASNDYEEPAEEPTAPAAIVMTEDINIPSRDEGTHEDLLEADEEIDELHEKETKELPDEETQEHEEVVTEPQPTFSVVDGLQEPQEDDDIFLSFEDDDWPEENTLTSSIEEDASIDLSKKEEPEIKIEKEVRPEPSIKVTKELLTRIKPAFKRQTKLKSAFSLNDRFLYARELFDGNMKMFDSTLDFIEGIEEYSIIEDYFYNELEWDPENSAVISFMEILRPQFKD